MLSIVLARNNIREFDQMVSLYTREAGKIEVMAKGIKKITSKNSSNLEVFSMVDIEVAHGKEIDHLTKVQPVTVFQHIYTDFDKMLVAGYVVKITNEHMLVGERDERVFDFLLSFLDFLNTAENINSISLVTGFIFKLWHYLGFGMEQEQYRIWLEGDWQAINNLVLSKVEQERAYQFAHHFAETHSGKRLAKFMESDRIFG
jgi:DNA repair protein RecO (recombination protein O)